MILLLHSSVRYKKLIIAGFGTLIIAAIALLHIPHPVRKADCFIHSRRYMLFSQENYFGLLNLNTTNVTGIHKDTMNNTLINSSKGSIITVNSTSSTHKICIQLNEHSVPDLKAMDRYLCKECLEMYSHSAYDIVLIDFSDGEIYTLDNPSTYQFLDGNVEIEKKENDILIQIKIVK